jgi:hypothetical protein
MTVMLRLEPSGLEQLREEAADLGVSVEQLATDIVSRHLRTRAIAIPTTEQDAFRRALSESVQENEELLRRLAK